MERVMNQFEQNFFNQMCEKEVWKRISGGDDIIWNVELLEKYKDKLDWKELSSNTDVHWNIEKVDRFIQLIDFDELSGAICYSRYNYSKSHCDVVEIIRKHSNKFNWNKLSEGELPSSMSLLEEFKDKWDWKEIISNRNIKWDTSLFNRYRNYIPIVNIEDFTRSELFDCLMNQRKLMQIGEILGSKTL